MSTNNTQQFPVIGVADYAVQQSPGGSNTVSGDRSDGLKGELNQIAKKTDELTSALTEKVRRKTIRGVLDGS